MKKIMIVGLLCVSGSALAAAGDQTLSVGYIQVKNDGLKKNSEAYRNATELLTSRSAASMGGSYTVKSDGYNDPKGMFIRYRYEYTDELGVIASVAYAAQDGATTGNAENTAGRKAYNKTSVKGDYISVLAGPSWRLNDYASLYGLAGVAVKTYKSEYFGRYTDGGVEISRAHASERETKTNLAYGIGTQINVYKGLVIDASFEGTSGSNDWKTNAFVLGVGYQF